MAGSSSRGWNGLIEVGRDPGVPGLLDEVALAEGREQEHRHLVAGGDLAGGPQAVHPGHLDVEDGEVRLVLLDQGHRLVAAARLPHHVVAGRHAGSP